MQLNFLKAINTSQATPIRSLVGLLLLLYVPVFIFSPGLVGHGEHEHVSHNVDSCKKDPCHMSIYHGGAEGSCHHKFHFTQDPEKCHWCNIDLARQFVQDATVLHFKTVAQSSTEKQIICVKPFSISPSQNGRGPPSVAA